MRLSRKAALLLRVAVGIGLAFIYIPLIVLAIYAFNSSNILEWPPPGWTLDWFPKAIENELAREAFVTSLKAGAAATAIAIVLGTLASLAVARHRFFGRETISFLVILPIALPGIVTGVALSNTFTQVLGVDLSLFTVIVGHATFCIVVVYNNVIARLRRLSPSFEEASADLGADTWQTFRLVTLPSLSSALGAGALLAFALSFDEIIVTTFTIGAGEETLPIWIFRNLFRPNQLPIVNAVAVIVVLLSIIPVYFAHRLTRDEGGVTGGRGGGGAARGGGRVEGGGGRVEGGGGETAATAIP
jgi:putative spermidine/putrescine transport system permease protein